MAFNGVDFASVSRQLDEAHAASRERTAPQPPVQRPMPIPYAPSVQQPRPSEVLLRRALALQDAPAGSTGAKVVTAGKMALGGASLGLVVLGALWVSRRITKAKDGGKGKDEALLAWDMDTIVPVVIAFLIGAGFTWLAKKLRQDKEQERALELLRASGQMPLAQQALPQVPAQSANDQLIRETLESAGISPNGYSALPVAT